jgi:glycosyltransferase involved in cell wall biosynthesis
MIVGMDAPLPPARTGVADYASALLPALREHLDLELAPADAAIRLYHLGNNQLHLGIYRRALARPGVAVLHDAVMQHFFLGSLEEKAYIEEFVFNYGDWSQDLARELWRGRSASATAPEYFRYPMLKRIAERSLAVVVHNPGAAEMVRRHAPGAHVVEIPHFFAPPPPHSGEEFRRRSGIPANAYLFGVFGFLRETKRVPAVLRAFEQLQKVFRNAALLVAGEIVSGDLERALTPLLGGPGIYRAPYLNEQDFWSAAEAVDACVNLRYPAAGETSGIAIRLMGIGKPVLLTGGAETSRFPEAACLRIASGPDEAASLLYHLTMLTAAPGLGREIGARAQAFIRENHSLDLAARAYARVLRECAGLTGSGTARYVQGGPA